MESSKCPRCFHLIGEHLYCRAHGGEDGWSAGAYKFKPKPIDPCPPEAVWDLDHEWWRFLDSVERKDA